MTGSGEPKVRRYFFDTEFRDKKEPGFHKPTDFISIGIVDEQGREYYAVNKNINVRKLSQSEPWLTEHVLSKLPPQKEWKTLTEIRQGILDSIEPCDRVEFWAKNGSYDNYLLCRLFGGMGAFYDVLRKEKGIQKVDFKDTKVLRDIFGKAAVPHQSPEDAHVAINDARQEKKVFDYYLKKSRDPDTVPKPLI